jgi:predicted tellurium resistance membrane protein TerC
MSTVLTPEFWLALSQIILINIVLSGDNAVVIALASGHCHRSSRKRPSCSAAWAPSCCAWC